MQITRDDNLSGALMMSGEMSLYDKDCIGQRRVFAQGELNDHEWFIVSYGSHPCAYVKSDIPEKLQDEILVHGSITFCGKAFPEFMTDGRIIGWDYNHCCDHNAENDYLCGKQWSVPEIQEEVADVINQLNEMGW